MYCPTVIWGAQSIARDSRIDSSTSVYVFKGSPDVFPTNSGWQITLPVPQEAKLHIKCPQPRAGRISRCFAFFAKNFVKCANFFLCGMKRTFV